MTAYIIKRLLLMVVTLFGITLITFAVTRLTPGEPAAVAQGAAPTGEGGYDSMIEQNRRNLGLDRPMFFNLRFEDRRWLARQALQDYSRPATFWQRSGERNLRLASTIALRPALEWIDELRAVDGPVDHELQPVEPDSNRRILVDDVVERIVALLPALAQERPEEIAGLSTEEQIRWWSEWAEANADLWTEESVEQAVTAYLEGSGSLQSVQDRGGYALPYLIRGIRVADREVAIRASEALTALTGISYLSTPEAWDEERDVVVRRWNSFWNRERLRYVEPGPIRDAVNILANTQFGVWFGQVARLDFGESYKYRRPVNEVILDKRLQNTILMSGLSIFFAYLISIPIGILSAVRRYTVDDKLITLALFILYSLPVFWTGQMLLLTLTGGPSPWGGVWPEVFPTRGINSEGLDWQTGNPQAVLDALWHLALPVLCITYAGLAFISRQMRSAMLETMKEDFIRTAQAKGATARSVILKHALRNSLIPIITISSGLLPELIAGSIVVESIFTIPGMGFLAFEAILNRDYPLINAILFYSAALTLFGILLADLAYAVVDPRITYD